MPLSAVPDLCCILQLLHYRRCLPQVKAGLTMSQRRNVEVGSLSLRSKHLQLVCPVCCVYQVSASFVALLHQCPDASLPNALLLSALLPYCFVAPVAQQCHGRAHYGYPASCSVPTTLSEVM